MNKKSFFILFTIISLFLFSNVAFATDSVSSQSFNLTKYNHDVKILKDKGIQEITIKDAEKFLRDTNYKFPEKYDDIKVTIQLPLDIDRFTNNVKDPGVELQASGYSISPFAWENRTNWDDLLGITSGSSGSITLNIMKSRAASYKSSVSVSAAIVSAGVGYDVTNTFTISNSCTENTGGRYTEIKGFPIYRITDYYIYYDGKEKGSGWAMRPIGVAFVTTH